MSLITLHCFANQPAPSEVIAGWNVFCGLSPEAQRDFWGILEPALLAPPGVEQEKRGEAYCEQHSLSMESVVSAVQACGLLFRQAASLDLNVEKFQEDLAALSGAAGTHVDVMVSRYASAKRALRQAIIAATLTDHGALLTGVNWSVQQLTASDRGTMLDASVVRLTLRYLDGDKQDRLTLQLTPDAIRELKAFTDRFGR